MTKNSKDVSTTNLRNDRQRHAQRPLETREVFLDTEVYRRLNYDLDNSTLRALFDHIDADRLRLHITDITLAEMSNHIAADAATATRKIAEGNKAMVHWRKRAPDAFGKLKGKIKKLDAKKIGRQAFANFRSALGGKGSMEHAASDQSALPVLRAYFAQEAPFDSAKSKEFPDAFVIEKLASWCEDENTTMYVVTADKAMLRAAEAKPPLRELASLPELLEIATISHSPEVENIVQEIVEEDAFVTALEAEIEKHFLQLGIVYVGELSDGETEEVEISSVPELTDWTIISASDEDFGLIVEVEVDVIAQVFFEDRSLASYDKEDDVYMGAESTHTEVEDTVRLKLFVRTDSDSSISQSEMLTRDIDISGSSDYEY